MTHESKSEEIIKLENDVIERIQKERNSRHMSQMDLALEAGISQGYLAMIESKKKIPTITTIFKIAEALKISPARLFEDSEIDKEQIKAEIISMIQNKL